MFPIALYLFSIGNETKRKQCKDFKDKRVSNAETLA